MDTFQVHILAADRTLYEGPCVSLTIPASDGERGILAHHSNMIAAVRPGVLRYQAPDRPMQLAAVSPGLYGCTDRVFLWHLSGRGSALSAAPPNLQQQQAGCQWGEELFLGNLPYGMGTGFCGECPLKRTQKSCKIVLSIKCRGKLP